MIIPRTVSLSQDVAYKVLSNPRRRAIIYLLRTADRPLDVMSLAESIASQEQNIPRDDLTRAQRKRVYVSLYQTHIPKLESVELIERDEDIVRPTARIHEVDTYLEAEHLSFPWYYLTATASVGALLVIGLATVFPTIGATGAYVVTALLLGILGVTTVGQCLERRRQIESLPPELRVDHHNRGETP